MGDGLLRKEYTFPIDKRFFTENVLPYRHHEMINLPYLIFEITSPDEKVW